MQKHSKIQLLKTFHLRIMARIKYPALKFLHFQVGQLIEPEPTPGEPKEAKARLFYLLGFGSTRATALSMAGLPLTSQLHEEIH